MKNNKDRIEYTIELKNGTAKDELVFVMPQYVGLMDIEVL